MVCHNMSIDPPALHCQDPWKQTKTHKMRNEYPTSLKCRCSPLDLALQLLYSRCKTEKQRTPPFEHYLPSATTGKFAAYQGGRESIPQQPTANKGSVLNAAFSRQLKPRHPPVCARAAHPCPKLTFCFPTNEQRICSTACERR